MNIELKELVSGLVHVVRREKDIILLSLFKKKSNSYDKRNKEELKRANRLIDLLRERRLL